MSLVLALLRARDEGIKLPSSVIINSIVADMSGKIQRVDTKEETTVTVGGLKQLTEMYAPTVDLKNPYISPIYANFAGLPPCVSYMIKGEVLAIDSQLVADKAKNAGVQVELVAYSGCFHAFTTLGKDSPESRRELIESSRFILSNF